MVGLENQINTDDEIPALIEFEVSPKDFRKNWARLTQNFVVIPKKRLKFISCFGKSIGM